MSRPLTRRQLLGAGGVAALGLGVSIGVPPLMNRLLPGGEPGKLLRSALPLPARYAAELPVPAVLKPVRSDAGADYYEITARRATARLLPGHDTEVWGYQGTFPGPTLESRSGRRTVVTHRSELPRPTAVHLHGGHTPHDSDGHPLDLVGSAAHHDMPGTSPGDMPGMAGAEGATVLPQRDYTYPMAQRAATLWYHDHTMGFTGPQVYRGLAGFHLVRDEEEAALGLPQGPHELPLMIADRSFAADGSFAYPGLPGGAPGVQDAYMNGVLGDVMLVNGAPWPLARVERTWYRLRLLNASNARRLRLALDPQPGGGGALVQIGSDGGLLERPLRHDAVDLAPAERCDVLVDFSRYPAGTRVRLRNRLGDGPTGEVMAFEVGSAAGGNGFRLPEKLSSVERLDPAKAVNTRTFVFQKGKQHWTVNGQEYRPGRSIAAPRLGRIEVWRFVTDFHHPVHLHLDPFQVLGRAGGEPGANDAGWKDTVDVLPAQGVEVAVRFNDYAGRFLLHCHNLEHEDMAMMAEFTTTE